MSKLERNEVCFMFHTLGDETAKQTPTHCNNMRNRDDTSSLKSLASKALERLRRNKERNTYETECQKVASHSYSDKTNNSHQHEPYLRQYSWVEEEYEERLAIAQYDGQQSLSQAYKIAYQDAVIGKLNTLPFDERDDHKWFDNRMKKVQTILLSKNITPTLPEE